MLNDEDLKQFKTVWETLIQNKPKPQPQQNWRERIHPQYGVPNGLLQEEQSRMAFERLQQRGLTGHTAPATALPPQLSKEMNELQQKTRKIESQLDMTREEISLLNERVQTNDQLASANMHHINRQTSRLHMTLSSGSTLDASQKKCLKAIDDDNTTWSAELQQQDVDRLSMAQRHLEMIERHQQQQHQLQQQMLKETQEMLTDTTTTPDSVTSVTSVPVTPVPSDDQTSNTVDSATGNPPPNQSTNTNTTRTTPRKKTHNTSLLSPNGKKPKISEEAMEVL